MILSLLSLDLTAPSVRQSLRDAQDLHRNLMKAFDTDRKDAEMLYRLMRSEKDIRIYVQSKLMPEWNRIEAFGFRCIKTKDISSLPESFHEGQVMRFSLLGCPAKKTPVEGKNSKRVLLRGESAQLDWLNHQAEKYGFSILESHITGKEERISGKRSSGEFFLSGVLFEGVLQVNDPEKFRDAFAKGIGAEKAYGFGMLMVSKP